MGKPTDQLAVAATKSTEGPSEESTNVAAPKPATVSSSADMQIGSEQATAAKELGGPKGLEPTRYGDWEKNGRCTDF